MVVSNWEYEKKTTQNITTYFNCQVELEKNQFLHLTIVASPQANH